MLLTIQIEMPEYFNDAMALDGTRVLSISPVAGKSKEQISTELIEAGIIYHDFKKSLHVTRLGIEALRLFSEPMANMCEKAVTQINEFINAMGAGSSSEWTVILTNTNYSEDLFTENSVQAGRKKWALFDMKNPTHALTTKQILLRIGMKEGGKTLAGGQFVFVFKEKKDA